jgi:hypothetical protein
VDLAASQSRKQLLAERHIADDAAGYKILLELLAEHGDTEENPIPAAIETSRGLLVAVLRTASRVGASTKAEAQLRGGSAPRQPDYPVDTDTRCRGSRCRASA